MGFQLRPAFSVFQTPPEPTATYHVLRFRGWITMSLIRPDISPGPKLRNSSPARISDDSGPDFAG